MKDEAGFTLTELLIGSMLGLLVLGGVLSLLDSTQATYGERRPLLDAQQTGRIVTQRLQRDLHLTGVGLAWLVPPLPLLEPTATGGFQIRHNQEGPARTLTRAMSGSDGSIEVSDTAGFEAGQQAALYDALGNIDLITVTSVDAANDLVHHDGASKAYDPADGAAVTRLQSIAYEQEDRAGVPTLVRIVDGGSPQVVATDVDSFEVVLRDDSEPPRVFDPTTVSELLRIQSVTIRLTLRAISPGGTTTLVPFRIRVSPRALVLS